MSQGLHDDRRARALSGATAFAVTPLYRDPLSDAMCDASVLFICNVACMRNAMDTRNAMN